MTDRLLDTGFYGLAERIVFLALPGAQVVVEAIEAHKGAVAPVADVGEEDKVLGDGVEYVAVQHEVTTMHAFMDVVFDNFQIFEIQREKLRENIVMIAAQVDDLRISFF